MGTAIPPPPQLGYDGGMEETKDEPRPHRRFVWIATALVAVFVLYPASFGPARALLHRYPTDKNIDRFMMVYKPLFTIADYIGSRSALVWYLERWRTAASTDADDLDEE